MLELDEDCCSFEDELFEIEELELEEAFELEDTEDSSFCGSSCDSSSFVSGCDEALDSLSSCGLSSSSSVFALSLAGPMTSLTPLPSPKRLKEKDPFLDGRPSCSSSVPVPA